MMLPTRRQFARAAAASRRCTRFSPAGSRAFASRFSDGWFRKYDQPTGGFRSPDGFVNRLPLRLESSNIFLYGTVDAAKMWREFEDEPFVPVLVGGKAVVNMWFNNFTDTDCGGEYWETWYNTFVTPKGEPRIELPLESPFSMLIQDPRSLVYLQRVICGDTPLNPGAAMKAITGGRGIWGFPKHPVPANLKYEYTDGKTVMKFDGKHDGRQAVKLTVRLPEADEGALTIPMDIATGPDVCIGGPQLGGTHKGMNGAHQVRYGQAFNSTWHLKPWDASTDSLALGEDSHYAQPLKRWEFAPLLKAHTSDMKIAAMMPSNWVSGDQAAAAIKEHDRRIAAGTKAGQL